MVCGLPSARFCRAGSRPSRASAKGLGSVNAPLLTAARLSGWLAISEQAVRKRLAGALAVPVPGARGQAAKGWPLAALPADWQAEVQAVATRKGFRGAEAMLADAGAVPWEPALPWGQVPERFQREAEQWREALAGPLARQHEGPPGEVMAEATAAAGRVFGREVSADTVRRRFDLACERDRGFQHWARQEIYLSEESQAARPAVAAGAAAAPVELAALTAVFSLVKRPDALTAQERGDVWRALVTFDGNPRAALAYARQAVPGLVGGGPAAWARAHRRKSAGWAQDGCAALADRRARSGRKAKSLCPHCLELVKGGTVEHDGNLPLAWRRLMLPPELGGIRAEGKGLCDKCAGLWRFDVRGNKSYVPEAVRRLVLPDVAAALPWRHGPKRARLVSPYVRRNPDDIGPGDIFEADDVTWNHPFWTTADNGTPFLCRGECLLFIDRRTFYPLAWRLIPGRLSEGGRKVKASYTGVDVRLGVLKVHDLVGLPHLEWVFENGVWRSRLVAGASVRGWNWDGQQLERGLNEAGIGCGVRHTTAGNPRSKLIERVIGTAQERMRPEAGFVGFNHRDYAPEKVNELIRLVKSGKVHPAEHFHSLAAFGRLLGETLAAYAAEPQNGDYLPGVSPQEAWQNGIGGKPGVSARPVRKLPDAKRYLLATHGREIEVGAQGIVFEIGGRRQIFWGPELAPHQRRKLAVRWNLEEPDLLHCLPAGAEPFTLRDRVLNSSTATRGELTATKRDRNAFIAYGKAISGGLPRVFAAAVQNDSEATAGDVLTAEAIEAAKAEERARKATTKRQAALAGALGVSRGEKGIDEDGLAWLAQLEGKGNCL
jgi:hypothetical protein